MEFVELVLTVFAALASGALVAGANYLRQLRNEAKACLRILTGEEQVEDDRGLVHRVEQLAKQMRALVARVEELATRVDRIETQQENP